MLRFAAALVGVLAAAGPAMAQQPGEPAFRSLYKELVETNTTFSEGSCTLAAERMAARLKEAGFPDSQLTLFAPPTQPKAGGLVAVYPGTDRKAKPILLLAHIDVVEAKREDWTRDPFKLVEEDGYFYARGSIDDKAMAAIYTDLLIRFKKEGFRPRRGVKIALTCGEESGGYINGAHWLTENRRDLIDAAFGLNEGAGIELDGPGGKPVVQRVAIGSKMTLSYRLEVHAAGGHSARPTADNAIYTLANALNRVAAYRFPVQLNDVTRAFFLRMAKVKGGAMGDAMNAIVANPNDEAAYATVASDVNLRATLGTTCVATRLAAGHADNALPQSASAVVNCRLAPGNTGEQVRQMLADQIANPEVTVSIMNSGGAAADPQQPSAISPPLTQNVMGPVEAVSEQMWPGLPIVPVIQNGGSDSNVMTAAGIPTYGVSGLYLDPDYGRMHGLNERVSVKALLDAREFNYRLVKIYAQAK